MPPFIAMPPGHQVSPVNDPAPTSVPYAVNCSGWGRRGLRYLAAAAVGAIAVIAMAQPASAHAVLAQANPQQGTVLGEAPTSITLVFSEPVQVIPGKTQVFGPDGKRINAGDPVPSERGLTIALRASRPLGTYLVSYRIISADSHPISGAYTFSVGAPSDGPPPVVSDGIDATVQAATPVAKYVGYLGLVLAAGPVLMLALWYPRRLARRGLVRTARTGLALIGASTLAALWLQAPASSGAEIFDVSATEIGQVLASSFGLILIARLAIVAAVAVLASRVGRRPGRRLGIALGVLAVAGMLTWPLTGHPAASPQSVILVAADVVHLAAMAFWLGGLAVLVAFLLRRAEARELGIILPSWSRWAAIFVYWLVAAGVLQAVVQTGSVDALVSSGYGRLLLTKAALVILVLAVAAVSRRLVQRGTAAVAPGKLRRAVAAEAAIAVVVLAASAVLVQTTPARTIDVEAEAAARAKGFVTTLNSPLYAVQFEVFPAEVGEYNTLHAYAYSPEGKPLKVMQWTVTAALPERGIEPIDNPVGPLLEHQGLGNVAFPYPGRWKLSMTLRVSDIDQATVTTTIAVS